MAYETKLCAYIIFEHLPKLAPIILRDKKHVASMDTLNGILYFWGGCLVGCIIYHVSLFHLLQKLTPFLLHRFWCVCCVKLKVKQVLLSAPQLKSYPPKLSMHAPLKWLYPVRCKLNQFHLGQSMVIHCARRQCDVMLQQCYFEQQTCK